MGVEGDEERVKGLAVGGSEILFGEGVGGILVLRALFVAKRGVGGRVVKKWDEGERESKGRRNGKGDFRSVGW